MTPQSIDPLNYVLPNSGLVDFFRIVAILLGLLLMLLAMVRLLQHERFHSAIAFMGLGLLTSVQETQQLGHEFLPWRLPVLIVACASGIRFLYYSLDEIKKGPR